MATHNADDRDTYVVPSLTVLGSFESITQATATVLTALDATFPVGTPFTDLTFS